MVTARSTAKPDAKEASSLEQQLLAATVAVVTTPACPYCKRAKEALSAAQIGFVEVNAGDSPRLRARVQELSSSRTVPQVSQWRGIMVLLACGAYSSGSLCVAACGGRASA